MPTEREWAERLGVTLPEDEALPTDLGTSDAPELQQYSISAEDIKAAAMADLDFLAAIAMPDAYEHEFPVVLKAAWKLMKEQQDRISENPQIALGIPRGHGKTTLIKLYCLYIILFTQRRFILVTSSTEALATNFVSDVMDFLAEPNIKSAFGDYTYGMQTDTKLLKKFHFQGRPIVIAAVGAGGSVRGLNLKNERPDTIIFDDIQTRECSESQVQSEALMRWMVNTAMKAKSPKGCLFLFCGNMFPGQHSILKKLKVAPEWIKFISGAILQDGTALWPALRSYESLIKELNNDMSMGHPEAFFSEVLNDTDAGINTTTDLSLIRDWKWTEQDIPQGKYIIVDPANDKSHSDAVAIGYIEVYDGVPGLRKQMEKKLSPGDTIRYAILMALQNNVSVIAVESTAYQYSLLYWFNEICRQLNITGLHIVDVYTGMLSKNARINHVLKQLTAGEIYLHPEVKPAVLFQISNWNPLKRDNVDGLLDLLAYAPRVLEEYAFLVATDAAITIDESGATTQLPEVHAF